MRYNLFFSQGRVKKGFSLLSGLGNLISFFRFKLYICEGLLAFIIIKLKIKLVKFVVENYQTFKKIIANL